jgi:hypothetical protein
VRGWAATPARHRLRRFELGLREGRSSTELRWPPAKNVCGRERGAMASGKKIHAGVGSDGSRAKACVGRVGAGHPIEPPCVGTMGLSKVYALRAILVTVGKP